MTLRVTPVRERATIMIITTINGESESSKKFIISSRFNKFGCGRPG